MTHAAKQAYTEWQEADAKARQAEERLRLAWERFEAEGGQPPGADLMEEISRCRAAANEKLCVAMGRISVAGDVVPARCSSAT
jgi:hypothetical protein